jgi:hypothetical protein
MGVIRQTKEANDAWSRRQHLSICAAPVFPFTAYVNGTSDITPSMISNAATNNSQWRMGGGKRMLKHVIEADGLLEHFRGQAD